MTTIIVFSHLRWDFVFQRPQQLMSRLAKKYQIVFLEEPVFHNGKAHCVHYEAAPNVLVVQPHTPISSPGFHDDQLAALTPLVPELISELKIEDYIVWLYTPMALPLINQLQPKAIAYDCMDELTGFLNAPRQLVQREHALLKAANVVFTGGISLYNARRDKHPAIHCLPSSVDAEHFSRAIDRDIAHPAQQHLDGPRLGFFGVIDERLDLSLIAALADSHPEWQIAMVGPVVKIPESSLPQRPNIHYFGQQAYEQLPHFLAGWDVCLLPFALNDATRYISPTKTLEYMAAELPIVSTPIKDVEEPYGHLVHIAADAEAFIAACETALNESPDRRQERLVGYRKVLSETSWDRTADTVARHLEAACRQGLNETARLMLTPSTSKLQPQHFDNVILGAGPTGLAAAYYLPENTLLVEKNAHVGGCCRSINEAGFTFDHAGHIMFSNDNTVLELYDKLLGANMHWQNREAWVYSKNVHTRYPFQGALYGLPVDVIKECIIGAVEARFGKLGTSVADTPPKQASSCKTTQLNDCCADGIQEATAPLAFVPTLKSTQPAAQNFEDFIYQTWGAGIAKHFAIPYNRKLWAVPLKEMETSWLGGRVPLPNLEEMIEGALQPVAKPMGPNARFGYPLRGGFQALMEGFLPHLKGKLQLNTQVAAVSPSRKTVTFNNGRTVGYDQLISTMPLPALVRAIGDEAPDPIKAAAKRLRHVSVRCVNLGIGREALTEKHWIYYPEDTVFHRIFVQGNASPHCNPEGGFGLTCEITYSPSKPLPCDGDELIKRCIEDCIAVGMIQRDDPVIVANQVDIPYAYVVYDHARAEAVATIREWLTPYDILLAGRYSEWEYYNSDHAFLAGKRAAEAVQRKQLASAALKKRAKAGDSVMRERHL
jgi:UDP-galactopyranose mutase